MEHLLAIWPRVAERLRGTRHILLLSDYDGTLTPIVERPEQAYLPEETRRLLQRLAAHRRFTVGIISGRALADLKNKVNINGIIYSGNHGLEMDGPGVSFIEPLAAEMRPFLRIIEQLLKQTLRTIKGVIVEDKGLSLSVHYRQVEEDRVEDVKNIFERIVGAAQALGKVRVTSGKKVYEVRPAVSWHKGKAIELLTRRYSRAIKGGRVVPIYLGDDLTDEDGFRSIKNHSPGLAIFVGEAKQETAADYYLKSPEEVCEFLRLLLEFSRRGFK